MRLFRKIEKPYLLNKLTGEIHRIASAGPMCHIDRIKHGRRITGKKANRLLKRNRDGCHWCWPEEDNG